MRLPWLMLVACGGSTSGPSPEPDAGTGGTYDPASLYDLDALADPSTLGLQLGIDAITEAQPGRFVREIRFGFLGSTGFPVQGSRVGVSARMFVETTAAGVPIGPVDGIAIALHAVTASPEYGVRCTLRTGAICVLAGNVAAPSQIDPPYPSEYGTGTIGDSNQLWFNLLSELRRGTDIDGRALAGPPVRRAYDTYLAEHAMRTVTAAQEIATRLFGAPKARFVLTGHSKWGAAAAQVAAVDPRVEGALVMGFALDFARFVELADTRWRGQVGLDLMPAVCPPEHPCGWASIEAFHAFFAATPESPERCGSAPCVGTGEDWLRQIDLRRLVAGGHLDGKAFALIRNGAEAHAVDVEAPAVAAGHGPDQFLFLPDQGHVFDTPFHASLWRHWVRHVLRGRATPTVTSAITSTGGMVQASVAVTGATVTQARLFVRDSTDEVYGELDGVPGYTPTASWRMATALLGATVTATLSRQGSSSAVVVMLEIDDGSGDLTWISTPVTIVR